MRITPLGYALIGLSVTEPRTGYALRKVFETSPLGAFSSSPGSIYPALAKLVKAGLLVHVSATESAKPIYTVTGAGQKAFIAWLAAPVEVEDVANEVDNVLLRFAFHEAAGDNADTSQFLFSFKFALETHLKNLHAFMASEPGEALSNHGRLAVENGIGGYESQLIWADRALNVFSKHKIGGPK